MEKKDLMTTQEVADYLRCSTHYVTALRRQGKIKGTYIGSRFLYDASSVYSLLSKLLK